MDDALEVRGLQDQQKESGGTGYLTPSGGIPSPPPCPPPDHVTPADGGAVAHPMPPDEQAPSPAAGAGPAADSPRRRRPRVGRLIAHGLVLMGERALAQLERGHVPLEWNSWDRRTVRAAARYCIRLGRWVLGG